MKKLLVWLACATLVACNGNKVSSPDGTLTLDFQLRNGQPAYALACQGKEVLQPSPLGLVIKVGEDTLRDLHWSLESMKLASADTTWETVWGEERFIRDHHNEMKLCLTANTMALPSGMSSRSKR